MQHDINEIVGLSVEDAIEWAKMRYMTIRATQIDGEPQMGDCMVNLTRINVEITDGKISRVRGLG